MRDSYNDHWWLLILTDKPVLTLMYSTPNQVSQNASSRVASRQLKQPVTHFIVDDQHWLQYFYLIGVVVSLDFLGVYLAMFLWLCCAQLECCENVIIFSYYMMYYVHLITFYFRKKLSFRLWVQRTLYESGSLMCFPFYFRLLSY